MLKNYLLLVLMLSGLAACTSGRRAFEKGDYERSIYLSVDRLRRSPDHKKTRQTLAQAYPLFIKKTETDINSLSVGNAPFRWDAIAGIYQRIHRVADEITACPAALQLINAPARYDARLQEANKYASEEHYNEGLKLLAVGTRPKAKEAYQHFEQANIFYPNLKSDYTARLNEAKQKATIRLAIFLSPTNANTYLQQFGLVEARTRNEINGFVQALDKRTFIDADMLLDLREVPDADDLVRLAYNNFQVDKQQFNEKSEQRLDSIRHEKQESGKTLVSYEKVWAEVAIREKTLKSNANIEILITDVETGQALFNQSVAVEYIWSNKWAILRNGDKRALSKEQLQLLEAGEQMLPSYQTLFEELQTLAIPQIKAKIEQYYRQY